MGVFTHTASPTLLIPGSVCSCDSATLVPFMWAWYMCIELAVMVEGVFQSHVVPIYSLHD